VVAVLSDRWTSAHARPLLLGHRGARHAAPENTFAAFDLALDEGAEGVEFDVRLNASGDVIVCHDVTLERVTEGRDRRAIHDLSSSDCDAVRLAGGERLPRLLDVMDWAERRHACLNIELKADGKQRRALVSAVSRLTHGRPNNGEWLISCFNALVVLAHRMLAPDVPTAWLIGSRWLTRWPVLPSLGSVAVHPHESLVTAASMSRWKAEGQRVHVWTVNNPSRARELAALGVDCLISDNPGALRRALEPAIRVSDANAR
jgi:glycerophosphoryl diester phosphodiesterase